MGVVINPNSELGREYAKWEQHHTQYTMGNDNDGNPIVPGNPYVKRFFPSMLYMAREKNGKVICLMPVPHPHDFETADKFDQAVRQADTWNTGAWRKVYNEDEMGAAKNQGWCESPSDAIKAMEKRREAVSNAAAETAFHARGMSEQARAEYAAAEASTHEHVTDVIPKRKRGRPAKGQIAVGG